MALTTSGVRRGVDRWSFRTGLGCIAAAAAVLRIVVYLTVHRHRIFGFNDADYYSQQAVGLAHGHWFLDPTTGAPVGEHGPLTSVVLVPLSWFDRPHEWQRAGTLVLGVGTVVVLGLVARLLGGRRAGLVAAAVAAVYPNLWINDGIVMSESLTALLVSLWLLCGLLCLRAPSARAAAWFGAVAGLAALARSELVLLVPAVVLIVWCAPREARRGGGQEGRVRRPRDVLCAVLAAVVVLAPWVVPNLVRFERPVLLSTNDGTTMRGANCDRAYTGPATGGWSVLCLVIEPATVGLEPSVRTVRWRGDATTYASEHAARIPVVLAARVGRSLDLYGLGYQVAEDVRDGRPRLGSWLAIVSFWIAAPIA
ncbi:MAG: Dolichyl-phosphate-mannose-protein mannosyltransferase, partial [Ilumatobacteraceae bacterium]|nr:Dolichyl-phosphate-mannose-protein mannosyltransferase [Ilumatobacteraceae bacterium]